ncbi:MAG: c-type cytochrome [Gammaproteobacteria bacterium]|nr:c-type cytochrome [Gammaproteobacteria bacterium]
MTPPKAKLTLRAAAFFFLVGIVLWGVFNTAMEATNTLGFCISCHEMESTVYQEYRESVHFRNATGIQAVCADCHVPAEWTAKLVRKVKASKEVYYWLTGSIDTPEKFEARRLELARHVWQSMEENDSRECRNCHSFNAMSEEEQGLFASGYHAGAQGEGGTCIDCHKGIAHHLPGDLGEAVDVLTGLSPQDLEYADEINQTCAGCHGEYGQGSLDGEYPRLAGLDAAYLVRQIGQFKNRERVNIPMLPYATERELPDDDTRIISAYLASIELPTVLPPIDESKFNAYARLKSSKKVLNIPRYPGNAETGKRLYQRECSNCHGADGYGNIARATPQLAGQHSLYLKRQIDRFRKNERIHYHSRDAEIFRAFVDVEIDDILAFLSIIDD